MKIYGYPMNTEQENPSELSEVTISASVMELREMAVFLEKCAAEIEQHGSNWEHEHFQSQNKKFNAPSLIVFNQGAE